MIEPKTVTTKTTYYTITTWKYRNTYGKTLKVVYPDIEKALKVFYDIINTGKYYMLNLRENIVYVRTETTEVSTNTPIAQYEDGYSFADLCIAEGGK